MLEMIIRRPVQTGEPGKTETAIEFSGDLTSLLVELTFGISCLHTRLKAAEPCGAELARQFRKYLIQALTDPDGPVWTCGPEDIGGVGIAIIDTKGGTPDV